MDNLKSPMVRAAAFAGIAVGCLWLLRDLRTASNRRAEQQQQQQEASGSRLLQPSATPSVPRLRLQSARRAGDDTPPFAQPDDEIRSRAASARRTAGAGTARTGSQGATRSGAQSARPPPVRAPLTPRQPTSPLPTASPPFASPASPHPFSAFSFGEEADTTEATSALSGTQSGNEGEESATESRLAGRHHVSRQHHRGDGRGSRYSSDRDEDVNMKDLGVPQPTMQYLRTRRSTVCGESTNLDATRQYIPTSKPKSDEVRAELLVALQKCHLFSHLDVTELGVVVDTMDQRSFVQGDLVISQGTAPDIQQFFVITQGEVSMIRNGMVERVLMKPGFFGERNIMFVATSSTHTFRVDTPTCTCYALDQDAYRHILTRAAVTKHELYSGFLDRVHWLKGLDHKEKIQLADALQPMIYEDGAYLIEYNKIGSWMFLIIEGTVSVYGRENGEVSFICTFEAGDCVGELEFINNHRTVADVRATGKVKAARLHRDHFELCMGPIVGVLERSSKVGSKFAYYNSVLKTMRGSEVAPAASGGSARSSPHPSPHPTALQPAAAA